MVILILLTSWMLNPSETDLEGYYLQLYSPHGLIRYNDPEIGRNKDTGGQVKYVIELLECLSQHPLVRKIDLFTRRISDKRFSPDYEKEIEEVNEKARIVRISCGGLAYKQKESLWDYLDEFIDKTIRFIIGQNDFPDVVHGHYADGNYIAGQLGEVFGIPFIATAHSLGRNKQNILLQQGLSVEKINEKFNMSRRIAEEEKILKTADAVIVSTQQEVDVQYRDYENRNSRFVVIPPGVNQESFFPFYRLEMPSFKMTSEQEHALYRVNSEIDRFLFNPAKPLILSIGRADKRKNFETIIQCYGQDKELQAMANLAIFAGVRKDILKKPEDEQEILTNLLLLLDKYDLYGKMAIPKRNDPKFEVPEIYRVAARKKGVFVNATPGENFGLTVIEAAACGLPIVASHTGGPQEIVENCKNGLLVDVENPEELSVALKKIISDQTAWETYSSNGVRFTNVLYSWDAHAQRYIETIQELLLKKETDPLLLPQKAAYGKRFITSEIFIITDLDGTLFDKTRTDGLKEFKKWIKANKHRVIFGIASGRNLEITKDAIKKYELPTPEIIICSAGSEIYYSDKFIPDNGWASFIDHLWDREALQKALEKFPGIQLQEPAGQRSFKLSYYTKNNFSDANLSKFLKDRNLKAKVLLTEGKFLDFLPFRASKGNAVRYLSNKWKVRHDHFITAGNSGNDLDMLEGKTKGIVVANYSPELESLKTKRSVYFSSSPLAEGVLEGILHCVPN